MLCSSFLMCSILWINMKLFECFRPFVMEFFNISAVVGSTSALLIFMNNTIDKIKEYKSSYIKGTDIWFYGRWGRENIFGPALFSSVMRVCLFIKHTIAVTLVLAIFFGQKRVRPGICFAKKKKLPAPHPYKIIWSLPNIITTVPLGLYDTILFSLNYVRDLPYYLCTKLIFICNIFSQTEIKKNVG